ncbi:MAG: cardiolipin synthase [Rhodospirillales bacterium 24-66-33]|uniref:phospholipase D-like domain-containing protein n=1 Tax=Reyranella sp. TaxID=1929291 RepID=UPI000BD07464|nr:phospholipase D-like domain-containing protein [Reyranella sp.]OYY40254.1 MAG: cardiolipin synthase [Rhodospirillales bacterium 35-66-84]OYZ92806.1 MAG: cardiolipin synthase [Rhodospirillales bacterium 24-66-33]OZB22527.1 MAG: cardiolipin synthase [Rhodospirillales bacterium 39-66-50]HQS18953.1 phospholipase D-like domain-containing protein [Reyranella sp.]HQT12278.1 phospholipase D-like domain-containing protein [Reyranella sp.]
MTVDDNLAAVVGATAAVAHVALAVAVTVHVLLYKRSVGAAVSWIGIAWLSPFLGGLLYAIIGINRVKRRAQRLRRQHLLPAADDAAATVTRDSLTPLEYAVGRVTGLPSKPGNIVEMMHSGDEAYPRMLEEIGKAKSTIGLCSYIFRADSAGEKFHEALIAAQQRGVKVRVLIDGVGGGYFWSGTYNRLRKAGVPVARFLHSYFPWRTPFVNLRNHRKLLVIDGRVAFTGGLNIGAENVIAENPPHPVRDTHFRIEGPVVEQLTDAFADDWQFTTGEPLDDDWFPTLEPVGTVLARVVPSGPDEDMEQIEFVTLHAISCARDSIRVVTPYFLPGEPLTMALGLAAMRGIKVDILLPENSNHAILDWARRVPLRPLIEAGCRIWMMPAPFDHSKLMTIDDSWSFIGSANWDTRSFRLNFELNVELHDAAFARQIVDSKKPQRCLTLAEIDGDPLPIRLRNSAARLLQPYL